MGKKKEEKEKRQGRETFRFTRQNDSCMRREKKSQC
jgi:hypothetical protein